MRTSALNSAGHRNRSILTSHLVAVSIDAHLPASVFTRLQTNNQNYCNNNSNKPFAGWASRRSFICTARCSLLNAPERLSTSFLPSISSIGLRRYLVSPVCSRPIPFLQAVVRVWVPPRGSDRPLKIPHVTNLTRCWFWVDANCEVTYRGVLGLLHNL